MNKISCLFLTLLVSAVITGGCGQKENPKPEATAPATSVTAASSSVATAPAAVPDLSKYVNGDPVDVMKEPAVLKNIKGILGDKFVNFHDNFVLEAAQKKSFTAKGDFYFGEGCYVQGCGSKESAFALNKKTLDAYAAIWDDGKVELFGAKEAKDLPSPLAAWVKEKSDEDIGFARIPQENGSEDATAAAADTKRNAPSPEATANATAKQEDAWFALGTFRTECVENKGPGYFIKNMQEFGEEYKTHDLKVENGSPVIVKLDMYSRGISVTFYKRKDLCDMALSENNKSKENEVKKYK